MDTVQMVCYVLADNEEDKEGSCSRGRAQVFWNARFSHYCNEYSETFACAKIAIFLLKKFSWTWKKERKQLPLVLDVLAGACFLLGRLWLDAG